MVQQFKRLFGRFWFIIPITLIGLIGVAVFFVSRLFSGDQPGGQTNPTIVTNGGENVTVGEIETVSASSETTGGVPAMQILLSEGNPNPETREPLPQATGEPLTEAEIAEIVARLPELAVEPEDQVDFRLPEQILPPPRTGETVSEPFPFSESADPPEVESGPLEVLRFAPEGEIPLAPFINVTFNQPMVPLTTRDALAQLEVPVQVEPDIPGTWSWVGTKTLTFEYDSTAVDRLPMATEYKITIPAGTRSFTGGELAEAVTWTFTTPPPQLISYVPSHGPQPLEPTFFAGFDQRIDPAAVLETISVNADGKPVALELLDEEEIKADESLKWRVENAGESRWLAFRALSPLPADVAIEVVIGPETPSAEGSLVTEEPQYFRFRTFAPLKILEHGCSWGQDRCPPLTPLFIRFNNPIDVEALTEEMITIEPALPGATIYVFGNTINIQGATAGQTTYRVSISEDLLDIFGQTLGKDERLSFRIGTADPLLIGPDRILVTFDPVAAQKTFSVYSLNYNRLELEIYEVKPSDWPAYRTYLENFFRDTAPPTPPGRLVEETTLRPEIPTDTLTEVPIDLGAVMDGEYGHFIVIVKPPRGLFQEAWEIQNATVKAWVQVTQIGLDAFTDHSEMVVWTTSLQNGLPMPGVTIQAGGTSNTQTTGEDGTIRLAIPAESAMYLTASLKNDIAILPKSDYYWDDSGWSRWTPGDTLRWYVVDDRQMYRPGEEVHIKGWLRKIGGGQQGDVGLAGDSLKSVFYTIYGPQGNTIEEGNIPVNAIGGFDFAFSIPENANLGYAQIEFSARGDLGGISQREYYHEFQIQEFRRPEFEVTARNETTGPYFAGGEAVVAVAANYFSGGPLPNAEVNWQVQSTPTNYNPPNWPDFVFGSWVPWWYFGFYEFDGFDDGGSTYYTYAGETDASGNHYLKLDFPEGLDPKPSSVLAEATVFDVNRQAWVGTTSLLVHPADLYVGLRSERSFVERGTPLVIDLIVTDLEGEPVADRPIAVRAARMQWKFQNGRWQEVEVEVQDCTVGSTLEPVTCRFETELGGKYQITAEVTDSLGRKNQSQFTRWVSGGQQPPSRKVEQESVTLIPDKESYQPGDVAQVLVQAPFNPAEGLLTVSRSGILYTERFQIDDETLTLAIPIEDAHIPNLHIQVDLVGSAPRLDDDGNLLEGVPERPAFATGRLNLNIPPLQRTLSLALEPAAKELEPGGETTLNVVLTDAQGQPVAAAELAVIVVDEAILALTNYQLADPISVFYSQRSSDLSSFYGRASIVLADPLALAGEAAIEKSLAVADGVEEEAETMMEAPSAAPAEEGVGRDQSAESAPPIRVRADFNPLATFAPEVRTDSQGAASIPIRLPDNLTRYRVMVVAVDQGNQFGSAETNLVARLPLMVRPSAPRFLNFGDRFELPLILQNQTDGDLVVEVVIQAGNLELTDTAGKRVNVPARDRIEVRFPATTDTPGTARFQIAAVSGDFADAAAVDLPVYTPATTEAFATYGVIDDGAIAQPVAAPTDVFPQFGGIEINTSSTALQALTDAVIYLVSYPYECSEQLSSRILGVAALRDVLTAFSAEGLPTPEEMESAVQRDIDLLQRLQNNDGGFPYWSRGRESIPFNTIHTAHALQMAKNKGFQVPEEMQLQVLDYLRNIESYYPEWYSLRTRQTLSAYALYVRDLMGDQDTSKALSLLQEAGLENLSLDAVGWLWLVLTDSPEAAGDLEAIRRHINNRVVETPGAANFTTAFDDQTYLLLSSNRRTDAILLDALIADTPQSDLIPKVVNGLLAHRTRGRWHNTQENVFVLLTLDRYFNTFEAETPDFVTRIWLGDTYAGSHEFVGRTTERHETTIPMTYLVESPAAGSPLQDLILSKEGTGRLYYRLGLQYAPTDLWLDQTEAGFVVQRKYEAVDDPEDVYLDEEGIWHIVAGARVRVKITMVADNRRYHVALVDPLPAGLEIINPALAVSGSIPQDPNAEDYRYGWWWWGPWYEHQNMRDERAEAFTALLWEGVYEYSYVARATTPGIFVVPPTKAEEMYSPEVFGRSGSDWVIVE